jgi:hypothetical protein
MSSIDPTFKVARIVYFTDLTNTKARVIPLGSLSEILLPHVHALALKARADLKPEELKLIGPLIRDRLAKPFAFLRGEFELAWENAPPGRAIEFLAHRHAASLSVLAPTDYLERNWLLHRLLPAHSDAVEGKLSAAVDSEFAELLKKYGQRVTAPRKVIESESREAA